MWTAEEEEIIRKYYPVDPGLCLSKLHGRTKPAIQRKAAYLGVHFNNRQQTHQYHTNKDTTKL